MRVVLAVLVVMLVFGGRPAAAQVTACTFTISDIGFGTVDLTDAAEETATGNIAISCTGLSVASAVDICIHFGAGSVAANGSTRRLQGPTTTLDYGLYKPPSPGTVSWGGTFGFGTSYNVTYNLPGLLASINENVTIYARMPPGQFVAPGLYQSTFTSGSTVTIQYRSYTLNPIIGQPQPGCTGLLGLTTGDTFVVSATVPNSCVVTTTGINFGDHAALNAVIDAAGEIDVTCNVSVGYTVELDGGVANAAPDAREMRFGGRAIVYGLYRNIGRTQPFGTGGQGVTGTGQTVVIPVYGRVPIQNTPPAGLYSDTVVVTLTY